MSIASRQRMMLRPCSCRRCRAERERKIEAARLDRVVTCILAVIPSYETIHALDDDLMRGTRPLPITLTLSEWRTLREILEGAS